MSTRSRYLVGIDLGTTNCAVAYVDSKGRERPSADIKVFDVPQLVAPGETAPRTMLPSFLYLQGPHELAPGAARLPWNENADHIVGEFARIQGARVASRLVSSAKSWLCHSGVDREANILPWGSPDEVRKVSPVDASANYLMHIRDSWNARFAPNQSQNTSEAQSQRLEDQEIVLTVPASFDEAARELTVAAARKAGFTKLTLIEEPQAAFYCWIVTHKDGWQRQVKAGELILVCDIGGGTTDFSLITVIETPDGPGFKRVAVGDHLMLGGDNIDLALAHHVEKKLNNVKLDTEQWSALRGACRTAKEKLLSENPPERWPVTIAGRGSKLIGGGIQSSLMRDEVLKIAMEGFFPKAAWDETPSRQRSGFQEFGLPFVSDPAIPRHLASFLKRHRHEVAGSAASDSIKLARPDAILFNGGALTPAITRDRLVETLKSWFPDPYQPRVLTTPSLDLAVAIGAAYYGVVRRGGGIRIGGGTARSFYVGFEAGKDRKPWLCMVPRDAQEGDEISIDQHEFDLLVGQPVMFPLASSSVRPQDRPGEFVSAEPDTILALPPLQSVMKVSRKAKSESARVCLRARVTEIGTIELWCQSRNDDRQWGLQIQLRSGVQAQSSVDGSESDRVILEQSLIQQGSEAIRSAFEPTASEDDGPSRLVKKLEDILELPRNQWPISALRALWEPLREQMNQRGRSPRHEARWLNLAGHCLRPGTGYPLDETRMKAIWPLFQAGLQNSKDTQCWTDWWIFWRRIAAGLPRQQHDEFFRRYSPWVLPSKPGQQKKIGRSKPEGNELAELWRLFANLERLAASHKETLGAMLAKDLKRPNPERYSLWCLGRLGARCPLYGPANTVVSPKAVELWLDILINRTYTPGRESADAIFAISSIARNAGDRVRDIQETARDSVIAKLQSLQADHNIIHMVQNPTELEAAQQSQAFGDDLPVGLRLVSAEE